MPRKPVALANWKMAVTVAESLAFVRGFQTLAGDCLDAVDVILCPPFTGLWPLAKALEERGIPIRLGAQNVASSTDSASTGQISVAAVADVGCEWVMLGHWEVRRYLGDDDTLVNRKVHLALEADLLVVPFVGEANDGRVPLADALEGQLERVLDGCTAEQVASMAFVYEPEGAIGARAPSSPEHVAAACTCIRAWLRRQWGEAAAQRARIIYGGSVAPEFAPDLLGSPDLDGLAATRRGRDPGAFAEIVRLIAEARRGCSP
jgi:triosephosphate isomerase